MKNVKNTLLGTALALSVCMGVGTTVFAAEATNNTSNLPAQSGGRFLREDCPILDPNLTEAQKAEIQANRGMMKNKGNNLTDEQRAEMEANREAMQKQRTAIDTKWNSLTDEQKEAVYGIQDEINKDQIGKIDKLFELGVIDEATRDEMKQNCETRNQNMRENGRMPMGRGGCSRINL